MADALPDWRLTVSRFIEGLMTSAMAGTLLIAVAGSAFDVRTRRIPNALTYGGLLAGLLFQIASRGLEGVQSSLAGAGVGLALFLPLFALGGMGAGDVKLMAALGAWLGPEGAAWTALYAAFAGGVMAVVVALARGYLRTAFANVWTLLGFWRFAGIRPLDGLTLQTSRGPRLPYALPITAGLFATLWLH
jgi:prepilin peptidase CpaA